MSKVLVIHRRLRQKERAAALSEVGVSNNLPAEVKQAYVAEAMEEYRQGLKRYWNSHRR